MELRTASAAEEGGGTRRTAPRTGPLRERPRTSLRVLAVALVATLIPTVTGAILLSRYYASRQLDSADTRLARELTAATAAFDDLLSSAATTARELSRSRSIATALAEGDRATLAGAVGAGGTVAVVGADGAVLAGGVTEPAAIRSAPVVLDGATVGRVDVGVPIDSALAGRLSTQAALGEDDAAILTVDGRVVAGPGPAGEPLELGQGVREAEAGGRHYRLAAASLADGPPEVGLAFATPVADIDRVNLLLPALFTALTISLLVALLVAWRSGRPRPAEEPVERRARPQQRDAVREALALVGDALAATHNPRALAPVILETTMEATGAVGGRLLENGEEIASAGRSKGRSKPLELPLADEHGTNMMLLLYPPRGGFSKQARELASWLADQAAIALESARLHRLVEQQAVTDELTQLANRRRFMEILELELSRAERFGGSVAIVFADLDNFKSINDRFGHQVGDSVLRAFADVLRERVRTIDMAARLGGEEFAVVLPQTDLAGGAALAERLRTALAERGLDLPGGERLTVTSSFGVAEYPSASSVSELINAADQALYRAKRQGKNRVVADGSS